MLGLFKHWRRRRILARRAIPDALWDAATAESPALLRLDARAMQRLRALALLFLHEKSIEPARNMQLDDAMRVRIAALACRPILELGLDCYAGFVSVIVYPDQFLVRDRQHVDEAGVVHTGDDLLSGEAWEQGPVVLAWQDVEESGRGRGFDVVAHEFAHKLDLLGGAMDGVPALPRGMRVTDWIAAFQAAYDDLLERLDRGEQPWLDPYAAESPAEFFAVCTEMFFDIPEQFAAEYPVLYAQLAAFFGQDPVRDRAVSSHSADRSPGTAHR